MHLLNDEEQVLTKMESNIENENVPVWTHFIIVDGPVIVINRDCKISILHASDLQLNETDH